MKNKHAKRLTKQAYIPGIVCMKVNVDDVDRTHRHISHLIDSTRFDQGVFSNFLKRELHEANDYHLAYPHHVSTAERSHDAAEEGVGAAPPKKRSMAVHLEGKRPRALIPLPRVALVRRKSRFRKKRGKRTQISVWDRISSVSLEDSGQGWDQIGVG